MSTLTVTKKFPTLSLILVLTYVTSGNTAPCLNSTANTANKLSYSLPTYKHNKLVDIVLGGRTKDKHRCSDKHKEFTNWCSFWWHLFPAEANNLTITIQLGRAKNVPLLSQELVMVRMWGLFLADKHCAHTHIMLQEDDIMRFELCFAQGMYHLYIVSLSVR